MVSFSVAETISVFLYDTLKNIPTFFSNSATKDIEPLELYPDLMHKSLTLYQLVVFIFFSNTKIFLFIYKQVVYLKVVIFTLNLGETLRHGCSVNLLHIFRTPFPRNTSVWLPLLFSVWGKHIT